MDTLIVQIMNQAQKLVNADRASLFLVDSKTKQLYARFRTSNLGDNDLKHDNTINAEYRIKFRTLDWNI